MSAVQPPRAARGRLRTAGRPERAASCSLVLAAVAVPLPWLPAGTEAAHAWLVLAGLLGSFVAALLGWAGLRHPHVLGGARRWFAVAGTVVGAAGVCLLLFQLPDVVLFLLSIG